MHRVKNSLFKNLKNRKLLYGLLQKSLLIICLIIVFAIVNNIYYLTKINHQFFVNADNNMNFGIEYLENRVGNLYRLLYSYEDSAAIINLAQNRTKGFDYKKSNQTFDVIHTITLNINAFPEITNIFVYFYDSDLMIDRNGSFTASVFQKYTLSKLFSPEMDAEISNQMTERLSVEAPRMQMLLDEYSNLLLYKSRRFMVILQLNDNINAQLALMMDPANVCFIATDHENRYFATNAIKEEHEIEPEQEVSHFYKLSRTGNAYGLQYTAYFNKDTLYYNQFNLYLFSLSLGILLIIGIAYILYSLKQLVYKPLEQILQKHTLASDGKIIDEYQLVEENLRRYSESIQEYEAMQKEVEQEIEISAFNHMLFDLSEGRHTLERALKSSQTVRYCVLSVDIEDEGNHRDGACCKRFEARLKENYRINTLLSMTYAMFYLVSFNGGDAEYIEFIRVLNELLDGLPTCFMICGVSAPWEDIAHLKDAYKQAQQALLQNRFDMSIHPEPAICQYRESPILPEDPRITSEQERSLINGVLLHRESETMALLQSLLYGSTNRTISGQRKLIMSLYDLLCIFLTDNGIDFGEFFVKPSDEFGDVISSSYYLRPLTDTVIAYYQKFFLIGDNQENNLLNKMMSFIDDNIERNPSLQELADEMNLSYAYMGRCFKEKMNMSYVEYVQRQKVELAKRLLTETDLNVIDISEKTGFTTANSFYRTFKSITGLTPNKFRIQSTEK